MNIGVIFPQIETTDDMAAIDEYVAAVGEAGYDHLLVYDHVVGADTSTRPDWSGPYTVENPFQEPLTFLAYLAATSTLGLMTGILVLPQRQTVLVAKQAAQIDLLSRGRFRLGVGVGWNDVEYEALGRDFSNRGVRIDEQIELMRRLWVEPVVDFHGQFETVTMAGIRPRPLRPVPVWLGVGSNKKALRRVARLGDGMIPRLYPARQMEEMIDFVRTEARQAGRDATQIGLQGIVPIGDGSLAYLRGRADRWKGWGATHLALDTMNRGLRFPDGHIAALREAAPSLVEGA
jgi:probable F420-dependent oxidoreductase